MNVQTVRVQLYEFQQVCTHAQKRSIPITGVGPVPSSGNPASGPPLLRLPSGFRSGGVFLSLNFVSVEGYRIALLGRVGSARLYVWESTRAVAHRFSSMHRAPWNGRTTRGVLSSGSQSHERLRATANAALRTSYPLCCCCFGFCAHGFSFLLSELPRLEFLVRGLSICLTLL